MTTLSLEMNPLDVEAWATDLPKSADWLYPLRGIRPGVRSPRPTRLAVHPSAAASAGWLRALWGFAV
jgi:hypothetical protein